ncbi:MAG TPA: PadR family transcriptional regulator [Anaerolineaceae bacterium]|jgi:DNA-binding PadR family transcriptional regulator|nr:PadR family transcriptional regulator [Anaerolineaceae bacterium]NMD26427.1 PadR family transcriptional regulator [Chloroflexota bacterium]HOA21047.1 PadR family transcriptional regulator [Anaerolineaceae bacterium]HOG77076.1 PadR family transcriptional regulator [Anaerolineaceae bacterium]
MQSKEALLAGFVTEMRRGAIALAVLSRLSEPGYGYQLVRDLAVGGVPVEANTLYPLLRRLEEQALLRSDWDMREGKPRKYYQRTETGTEVYERWRAEWKQFSVSFNSLLEDNHEVK